MAKINYSADVKWAVEKGDGWEIYKRRYDGEGWDDWLLCIESIVIYAFFPYYTIIKRHEPVTIELMSN